MADSASFAFFAERNSGVWAVTMANLWLPEQRDNNRRRIRLSVCFTGLETETQVRALALSYLNFPLEKLSSRSSARYCAELAACYSVAEDGKPQLQFDKMKHWAENAIANAELTVPGISAENTCYAEVSKTCLTDIHEIKTHLQTTALREIDGIRLLFDECYVEDPERDVDVVITVADSLPRIQYTPISKRIDEETKTCCCHGEAMAFAKEKYREVTSLVISSDPVKKLRAGCVILSILLGILLLILFVQGNSTARTLITVTSAHPCRVKIQGKGYHIRTSREIKLADSETGVLELEVTQVPEGSIVIFNGLEIGKAPGKFQISAQGGTLQILPPESVHPDKSAGTDGSGYFRGKRRFIRTPISSL
ncbi:MAG: hypothetical protein IKK73_01930 [Akkermansia sp.]|nr:hypothetical protein [Akkermansia sp.]